MSSTVDSRQKPDLREIVPTVSYNLQSWTQTRLFETNWDRRQRQDFNLYDIAELYHENTKMRPHLDIPTAMSADLFFHGPLLKAATRVGKSYSGLDPLKLPKGEMALSMRLDEAILSRRSVRDYSGESVTLVQLSKLLQYSNGITHRFEFLEPENKERLVQYFRAAPSGGGLFPNEIYLGILHAEDLKPGIYHYDVMAHGLTPVNCPDDFADRFLAAFPIHPRVIQIDKAAFVLMISALFERTMGKYGPRGYRYALQEAGHIAENAALAAVALGLGSVSAAGFYDDFLNEWLGIDGVSEAVTYTQIFGVPDQPGKRVQVGGLKALFQRLGRSLGERRG